MESLKDIKLIVCDMDGTLLHKDHSMDKGIYEVVKQLKNNDILFTLASGRNVHIMKDFIDQFSIDIPYITNNGANIFLKDTCLFEQVIERTDLYHILSLLASFHLPYLAYTNKSVYGSLEHESMQYFLHRLRGKLTMCFQATIDEIAKQDIFKIVVIEDDDKRMESFMKEVEEGCKNAHCVRSEGNVYALNHAHVSKGNALQVLLKRLQIKHDQVLVFGDNYNDLSMFEVVEHAVAMGNSDEWIKQKATYITKSNDQDGVSSFIKEHVL